MPTQMVSKTFINLLDMEEFDNYLDTNKLKKAIWPRNKRRKGQQLSLTRKPLSQNFNFNGPLVTGLKPNLAKNKRLRTLQI